MSDPIAALVGLAEQELALVREGRWDALAPLRVERDLMFAALPARLPESARPGLERALTLQEQVSATLAAGMAATKTELSALGRGRGALAGYAGSGVRQLAAAAVQTPSLLDARS